MVGPSSSSSPIHLSPFPSSSLHVFPMMSNNSPSSSSSTSSATGITSVMSLKTLIHSLVFSHICRLARALSKARSVLLEMLKDIELVDNLLHHLHLHDNNNNKNNPLMGLSKKRQRKNKSRVKLFGSFRLHYNWCSTSSHVMPIIAGGGEVNGIYSNQFYYDPSWNSIISTGQNNSSSIKNAGVEVEPSGLSGYLHWLEEEENKNNADRNQVGGGAGDHTKKIKNNNNIDDIDELADMFIASCHEKFRLEKQESYRRFQEMMARSM